MKSKSTDVIAEFLTNHKRGCLAIKGQNCTCGLYDAREAFEKLTGTTWNEASERYFRYKIEQLKKGTDK